MARNFRFHNLAGWKFEEIALSAGVAYNDDGEATSLMGADFRDFNLVVAVHVGLELPAITDDLLPPLDPGEFLAALKLTSVGPDIFSVLQPSAISFAYGATPVQG